MNIPLISKKIFFLIVILCGIATGFGIYANANDLKLFSQEKMESNKNFPTNELNETYGSARDVHPSEKEPDLIKAEGINGKVGYIRLTELNGETPKNLEEALSINETTETRFINVYEKDGKTVIDQFEVTPAIKTEDNEDIEKELIEIEQSE